MRHVRQLVRRDIELLGQDLPVPGRLVEHIDEIGVFEDVLYFPGGKQVLHVLGDACRNTAPLTEPLPDLDAVGGGLFLLQKEVELVHIVAGGLAGRAVLRDTAPDLVLNDQHAELFQLFAELLDVVADQTVLDIDVGTVVEEIQGSFDIDLQRRRHMVGFLFLLLKQCVVKVLQKRHVLRRRILEILLVDLVDTAVDDRLFHRLKSFLSADHQLAERQDEVGFQGKRVILVGVVLVDVHRIHILGGSRADVNNLALQLLYQSRVLSLRITDDHVVIRHQESIGDLTLGAEGLTGTGGSEDQAVRVL